MTAHSKNQTELLKELSVHPEQGLTQAEAAARLDKYGANQLREKKKKTNL